MPFLVPLVALAAGIIIGFSLKAPLWGALPILMGLGYYLFLLRGSNIPVKALKLNSRHSVWIFFIFRYRHYRCLVSSTDRD